MESGAAPEKIAALFDWRPKRVWFAVSGEANEEQFDQLARAKAEAEDSTFNPKRWFCEDDELLRTSGKTYAFSKQWGNRWLEAMERLKENFPTHNIEFKAVTSDEE